MIGQTLGHYRVLEQIGAGGMGVVYRAHDERLDRDVALKVLPAGTLADEPARKRFRKEALTLSKLNHPNIETVHDFDTQKGVDFLVMELIPGVTLDQKLLAGALPEKDVLRLGQQLAEGLAAAHEQSVIHRDLKPGNLRLTPDGRLKILDFGLAKLLQPTSDVAVTASVAETQAVTGTLPYMSPEQLRGEAADARSDIWAAGTVLYELATGRRPFDAKLSTALAADIQHKPSPSPRQLKPEMSPRFEDIILKCLEKDPEDRYQSAKELLVDLRRLATPATTKPVAPQAMKRSLYVLAASLALLVAIAAALAAFNPSGVRDRLLGGRPGPQIQSVAVLPFVNLSGDPSQEYFADGMTDSLITNLSKVRALKVISRTSVMRYKGTNKPMPDIARELGVDGVIEGSVLLSGARVRITAQLVHASTDQHVWAENYERDAKDVLSLQSEVAQAIAREIKVVVTPAEEALLRRSRPVNPEAHQAYLLGAQHEYRTNPEDTRKGFEYLETAVRLDPGYAEAWAHVAHVYADHCTWLELPERDPRRRREQCWAKAEEAGRRAIAIDNSVALANLALAEVLIRRDRNWRAAEQQLRRAEEITPNLPLVQVLLARYLTTIGRHDEALGHAMRAVDLAPTDPNGYHRTAAILYNARRFEESVKFARLALEVEPTHWGAKVDLALAYLNIGRHLEAVKILQELGRDAPQGLLGYAYASAGRRQEALQLLRTAEHGQPVTTVSSYDKAVVHMALGDYDQSLALLQQAYDEGIAVQLAVNDPIWDPLRADQRFVALRRQMNFPE